MEQDTLPRLIEVKQGLLLLPLFHKQYRHLSVEKCYTSPDGKDLTTLIRDDTYHGKHPYPLYLSLVERIPNTEVFVTVLYHNLNYRKAWARQLRP